MVDTLNTEAFYFKNYQKAQQRLESINAPSSSANNRVKHRYDIKMQEAQDKVDTWINAEETRNASIAKVKAQDLARDQVVATHKENQITANAAWSEFNDSARLVRQSEDYVSDDVNNYLGSSLNKECYYEENSRLLADKVQEGVDYRKAYDQITTDWEGFQLAYLGTLGEN